MQQVHPSASGSTEGTNVGTPKKLIGFAAMDPERQREIASLGGRAAQASDNAHRFNSTTGSAAAQKRGAGNRAVTTN